MDKRIMYLLLFDISQRATLNPVGGPLEERMVVELEQLTSIGSPVSLEYNCLDNPAAKNMPPEANTYHCLSRAGFGDGAREVIQYYHANL